MTQKERDFREYDRESSDFESKVFGDILPSRKHTIANCIRRKDLVYEMGGYKRKPLHLKRRGCVYDEK